MLICCVILTPEILGLRAYVVISGSMEPEIPTGSLVLVNTKFQELSEGTVISYRLNENIVTHRVDTVLEDGYRTRGDANERADEQIVKPDQVVGIVQMSVPCLGYLIVWLQSVKGRILVWIMLEVYLIALFFRTEKKDQKEKNEKENIRKIERIRKESGVDSPQKIV
jgi:signal peptidase